MTGKAWSGRKLHFIGIGGAGMSGLALVCHGLGASVTGSDRARSSYMRRVEGAGVDAFVGHDAGNLPDGAEVVVSTAIGNENPELARARSEGRSVLHRSDLLAELCAPKRTIAVAGTHGKTTTTGMLIWAMRELGMDPAFFVGGELPGVGPGGAPANSGWGSGEWVVVEADESDGSFLVLDPEIAVVTNIEMDHHSRWSGLAELREAFATFAGKAAKLVEPAGGKAGSPGNGSGEHFSFDIANPGPAELSLMVPGDHNLLDARAAIAALQAAGVEPVNSAAALTTFPGVRRRLEYKGISKGARVYDDYAHHPTEVEASLSALRGLGPERLIAVFQPHLYSRTKAFSSAFGSALALADEVVVLDVYPAREEPVGPFEGVSGLDVLRATADRGTATRTWWAPDLEAAERAVDGLLAPGRIAVTVGAGDVTRLSDRLVSIEPPPSGVETDYPLWRMTTVRTGGDADFFASPDTDEKLAELLAWAKRTGTPVAIVGSGSNLLVSDSGFRGLAMKLSGELTAIERDGTDVVCGGGARLASAAAKCAGWGLAGLEFGVNIPGTAGGAVRMNASAHGGRLADVLERVEICSADGVRTVVPGELGFSYRHSNLADGQVVSRVFFSLSEGTPEAIKERLAEMRAWRREARPSGIKTLGSTFKDPDAPKADGRSAGRLLDAAGCRGLTVGGARLSEKHANFVEIMGEASTADVIAVMTAARNAVRDSFGVLLEPEVQVLGEVAWPESWDETGRTVRGGPEGPDDPGDGGRSQGLSDEGTGLG